MTSRKPSHLGSYQQPPDRAVTGGIRSTDLANVTPTGPARSQGSSGSGADGGVNGCTGTAWRRGSVRALQVRVGQLFLVPTRRLRGIRKSRRARAGRSVPPTVLAHVDANAGRCARVR